MKRDRRHAASFRDPAGFLFWREERLLRQVNRSYAADYEKLMASGLHDALVADGLLVASREVDSEPAEPERAFKLLEPEILPFISYPYEWCFGQLEDAALTTLAIQRRALAAGMSLKDASAYNIQFGMRGGRPMLIDTLSFETYREGEPWTAYRQFCQHFLAPLALMAYADARANALARAFIDGIPLDMASALLPRRSYLRFGLLSHLHLHAKAQRRYADAGAAEAGAGGAGAGGADPDLGVASGRGRTMSKQAFQGLIDNLEATIRKLDWQPGGTEWGDYYACTNYSEASFGRKREIIEAYLDQARPESVWDLGANTGHFSRIASERGIPTLAFDIDHAAVEQNYRRVRSEHEDQLLPLFQDITNPSADIGWDASERATLFSRGPAGAVFALALIHHLAIGNNLPLERVAASFARLGRWLVIEFVPKQDSQVRRLLASRQDIFEDYHLEAFEQAFGRHYEIRRSDPIEGSERRLYLMERKAP